MENKILFTIITLIVAIFGVTLVSAVTPLPVTMGTVENFGVLAATTITNTGPTVIADDIGLSPGVGSSITGFPPGIVNGTIHAADSVAGQAQIDLTTAYNDVAGRSADVIIIPSGELSGLTLTPGLYRSGVSSFALSAGVLTLDAQGDANAIFIFQMPSSSLTTISGTQVVLVNETNPCNVFWQVGSSATIGTGSVFKGNILALSSITVTTGASLEGRALARNGAVTLDTNVIWCENTAQLTVIKHVINHGGSAVASDFIIDIISQSASQNSTSLPGNEVGTTLSLMPGLYSLNETGPAGYAASYLGDCVGANISLQRGDNKTCTITNEEIRPKLTVTKVVVNDNGGISEVDDFPLFVGLNTSLLLGLNLVVSGVENQFDTGSYIVSELSDPVDYTAVVSGDCASDGSITLSAGDVKHCTITNNDVYVPPTKGTLQVIKHVINHGGSAVASDFSINIISQSAGGNNTILSGSETGTTLSLMPGLYSLNETGPAGYAATYSGDCAAASISLQLGDNKTCTITNEEIRPKLTVTKVVVNDNGGISEVDDFPLFVDLNFPLLLGLNLVVSGVENQFDTGSYIVSELSDPVDYTAVVSGDCASDGSITLSAGDVKHCTITNDDIYVSPTKGILQVIKHVINDDAGVKFASDFTMLVSGVNPDKTSFPGKESGTLVTIDAGAYSVNETEDSGYTMNLSADCFGTIAAGQLKICTITNNDIHQTTPPPPPPPPPGGVPEFSPLALVFAVVGAGLGLVFLRKQQ